MWPSSHAQKRTRVNHQHVRRREGNETLTLPLALSSRLALARWAPLPLRLIVGYGFLAHGFLKLSKGPDAFATILRGMVTPTPHVMAGLTILVELVGGLAVL